MGTAGFEPQRVLAGRYRLDERLGAGGMGAIWRAEHLVLQAPVAVKLLDRDAVPDEETVARFMREAKAAASLRSPHVVQILDYGVDSRIPFIVMELLDGETLAQRLRRLTILPTAEMLRFVTHIGRAVGRAHEAGIVHRDLKPENVFIVKNEDDEIAKVLDFGVAKVERTALSTDSTRTRTGSILGTPYYMSPEQAQGNKTVDHRSDLWSLGVIAFECLTGRRPFMSDGLGDLLLQICVRELPIPSEIASVPIGFDAWFRRAAARDPDQRYQSAREMTEALRESLGVTRDHPEVFVTTDAPSRVEEPPPTRPLTAESGERQRSAVGGSVLPEAPTLAVSSGNPGAFPMSSGTPRMPQSRGAPQYAESNEAPRSRASSHVPIPLSREAPASAMTALDLSMPPPPHSGLTGVIIVAAVAIAVGLGGGVLVMKKLERDSADAAPSAKPSRVESPPPSAVALPSASAPSALPSATATPTALRATPSASAPGLGAPRKDVIRDSTRYPADRAPIPVTPEVPDAGWVKPAWAIPDGEPIRRDLPDEEDEADGASP